MTTAKATSIAAFTKGIVNKRDPFEVGFDGLLQALNINITDKGKPVRRSGRTLINGTPGHSIWSNNNECFFVREADGFLCRLESDYSTITPITPAGASAMYFTDAMGVPYYSNGYVIGKYEVGVNTIISRDGTYNRSDVALDPSEDIEYFDSMPPGICLEYHAGILYAYSILDGVIYYSRRNDNTRCDKENDFIRFSGVTGIIGVEDGVYFGFGDEVWFMSGLNPATGPQIKKVDTSGMVLGTGRKIPGQKVGRGYPGVTAFWESKSGEKVFGAPGGNVYRPHGKDFASAVGDIGTALFFEQHGQSYILGAQRAPGGNQNGFRATDYAEAEVRSKRTT